MYPTHHFNGRSFVKVGFEHGGTGVPEEFDGFEKFREFETEVEVGDKVLLEQLHVVFARSLRFGPRVRRFKLPFGWTGSTCPATTAASPSRLYRSVFSKAWRKILPDQLTLFLHRSHMLKRRLIKKGNSFSKQCDSSPATDSDTAPVGPGIFFEAFFFESLINLINIEQLSSHHVRFA